MAHRRKSVHLCIIGATALANVAILGCQSLNVPISTDSTATLDQTSGSSSREVESFCDQQTDAHSYVTVCATTTSRKPDTPIRDIPGSVQVIPRSLIDDQRALRVEDALRNVSGVQTR